MGKESTYCRNVDELAAALGLKLYDKARRRQRSGQLAQVKGLLELEGFPARVKRGKMPVWIRAQVEEWGKENVEVRRDGRGFQPVLPHPSPLPLGEGGHPAGIITEEERERRLKGMPADLEKRYRDLLVKWQNPNGEGVKALTVREHEELIRAGLVVDPKTGMGHQAPGAGLNGKGKDLPAYCSQSEFARICSELYNTPVYPMMVHNALHKEGMPGLQTNRSLKTSVALEWWERMKVAKQAALQGQLFADAAAAEARRKIADAKRAEWEAAEVERRSSDKWMEASVAEGFAEGLGLAQGSELDKLLEDRHGLRAKFLELIREWLVVGSLVMTAQDWRGLEERVGNLLREVNDGVKGEFAKRMTELSEKLKGKS